MDFERSVLVARDGAVKEAEEKRLKEMKKRGDAKEVNEEVKAEVKDEVLDESLAPLRPCGGVRKKKFFDAPLNVKTKVFDLSNLPPFKKPLASWRHRVTLE